MALDESAVSELLDALTCRRWNRSGPRARPLGAAGADRGSKPPRRSAPAATNAPTSRVDATQRAPPPGRCRPRPVISSLAIPKLRKGSVLPVDPRTAPADRSGVVRGGDGGLRQRRLDPHRSMIWSRRWAIDTGISKSEVSRICAGLDERVDAFRNRTLGHVEFPYVYLDATYVHVRDDALGQVVSRAVVIATGITANGDREVLGVDIGDSEDETFWTGFLRSLQDPRPGRGAAGDLRRPRRPESRDPQDASHGASAGNAAGSTTPATCSPGPQGPHQDVVAAAFRIDLRARRPRRGRRPLGRSRRHPRPTGSPRPPTSMRAAKTDVLAFTAFPPSSLAQDLVEQPARAAQQGDQATHQRRRHLPQRRRRHPPRRRRARRPTRRMGHRPPLPLRSLHGRTQPTTRRH